MNKQDLIQKLKQLDGLTTDEKAALIDLVKTKKKYGLVWEDKPEAVEEQLRQFLPVLKEVKEKRILAQHIISPTIVTEELFEEEKPTSNNPAPNHILIEGDNLHALTALTFTHQGKIDVIYIDPPYNTGNKDFKYNDSFVDKEDSFRHSKWLSFMEKRLKIAKSLLSETGVIFISIDDNEQAQLKLLCDEIWSNLNFVGQIAVINNLKGRSDEKNIATAHEYVMIFKNNAFETLGVPAPTEYTEEYKLKDNQGLYRLLGLRKRGDNSKREDRPNLFYPIYFSPIENKWSLDEQELVNPIIIVPKLSDGSEGNWRWGKETLKLRKEEIVIQIVKKRNEYDIFQKDYLHNPDNEIKRVKPKSFWMGSEYSTDSGTKSLKEIIPNAEFRGPKSPFLIKHCLSQSANKDAIVLDFFAGSGTSLYATMLLNNEDNGSRQCILITNNEGNICEEITYKRNKRAIEGYKNLTGAFVSGFTNNNLRYYKSEFVSSTKTEINKRLLTQASTELLQIKENCYTDITEVNGFNPIQCGVFTNEIGKYMIVVYQSRSQNIVCEQLIGYIKTLSTDQRVKLYAFSPEKETLAADFAEVADKVDALPLPDAIYNAYRATFRTLKLDRKIITPTEAIDTDTTPELFDTTTEA